jgi:hypothetical protein
MRGYIKDDPVQDEEDDADWMDSDAYHTPNGKLSGQGLARSQKFKKKYYGGSLLEKPIPYVPFGRYVIHKPKLNSGVLMVKYPSGATIKDLKTRPISDAQVNVLQKTISGQGVSIADIEDMQPDERNHIHDVLTKSHIQHNITKTRARRDDEDDDKRQLQIYIGEVSAGNDSPLMLKDLKKLVVKMVKAKRLSKSHADSIIYQLTENGI